MTGAYNKDPYKCVHVNYKRDMQIIDHIQSRAEAVLGREHEDNTFDHFKVHPCMIYQPQQSVNKMKLKFEGMCITVT